MPQMSPMDWFFLLIFFFSFYFMLFMLVYYITFSYLNKNKNFLNILNYKFYKINW